MSDHFREDTRKALLYELRLEISGNEKGTYTKEELCDWFDTIADAKEQE